MIRKCDCHILTSTSSRYLNCLAGSVGMADLERGPTKKPLWVQCPTKAENPMRMPGNMVHLADQRVRQHLRLQSLLYIGNHLRAFKFPAIPNA